MAQVSRVAVIGAGTMGSQIGLQVALNGLYQVTIIDSVPGQLERARATHQGLLQRRVERGRLDAAELPRVLSRIRYGDDLSLAADADLVIEAIYENLEAKREIFASLDALLPPATILASNSSTIGISRLASVTHRADRCCNLHFFHPATVMELVEVVRGPDTSDATVTQVMEFARSIGRTPILVNREIHGFIVNRIMFAAAEEAMRLLEGGYASADDIDTAVKKGLNWPMGPFELMDFSGLDVLLGALDDRARAEGGPEPPEVLRRLVAAGRLGRKSGHGFHDYPSPPA